MKRWQWIAATALGIVLPAQTAMSCADGGPEFSWNLRGGNTIALSPVNDTRVNLMLLLRDRGGLGVSGKTYPTKEYYGDGFAHTFVDWELLRGGLFPRAPEPEGDGAQPDYTGSRCFSLIAGTPAFLAAMQANRSLPAAERTSLATARSRLSAICNFQATPRWQLGSADAPAKPGPATWPGDVASPAGRAFLGYLQAADAFYSENWDAARQGFWKLKEAGDPWVAETAAYMLARVELNASQARSFDEYGYYDGGKTVDQAAVGRAREQLAAYLKRWPNGRYAASAQGLSRRVLWLSGDYAALGRQYEHLLGVVSPASADAADLVQEVDNKLLFNSAAGTPKAEGALLLATIDLMQMRGESADANSPPQFALTAEALAAQAPLFADRPELFSYLQASHAFYVAKDYRRVLQLIPDDAKQPGYLPLAFSRQVLRGMALTELGDRNEAGFWLELLNGATGLWQRPVVELGLAMNYERHGKLDAVFAPGSPITDPTMRELLLTNSAGPDLLRSVAVNPANERHERDMALYTLLDKQLGRGFFAQFAKDMSLVPASRKPQADQGPLIPDVAIFTAGRMSDGYACPAIRATALTLAGNPKDVKARLCLGDFWRLNGDGPYEEYRPAKDELGGAANLFPGTIKPRGPIYAEIIADPAAAPADKAYALFRAVNCYAPSASNGCGGEDVELPQRRAWFQRLKRDYPTSEWAKKLRYYW